MRETMMESIHLRDYMRITESIKSGPLFLFFPFGLMFMDSGDIWTEDTLAVILLGFIVVGIFLISWRRGQLDLELERIYAPNWSVSEHSKLRAKWNPSVRSPEEWKKDMIEEKKQAETLGASFIISGIFLMFLGFLIKQTEIINLMLLSGTIVVLFGFISLWPARVAEKKIGKKYEIYVEAKASWNITDFNTGKEAVEKFLHEKAYSYTLKNTRETRYIYKYDYTYTLDNGCYIRLRFGIDTSYSSYSGASTSIVGGTILGYKLLNYNEARKLQQELDEYLTERDILLRSEMLD